MYQEDVMMHESMSNIYYAMLKQLLPMHNA